MRQDKRVKFYHQCDFLYEIDHSLIECKKKKKKTQLCCLTFPTCSIFKHLSGIEKYFLNTIFKNITHRATSTANRDIPTKIRKKPKAPNNIMVI